MKVERIVTTVTVTVTAMMAVMIVQLMVTPRLEVQKLSESMLLLCLAVMMWI